MYVGFRYSQAAFLVINYTMSFVVKTHQAELWFPSCDRDRKLGLMCFEYQGRALSDVAMRFGLCVCVCL